MIRVHLNAGEEDPSERGSWSVEGLPEGWKFRDFVYGFHIMDSDPYHGSPSENVITVHSSPGQHGRFELMVVHTGVDGDLKTLNKGSIKFGDECKWIENVLNKQFAEWEESRKKAAAHRAALVGTPHPLTCPSCKQDIPINQIAG